MNTKPTHDECRKRFLNGLTAVGINSPQDIVKYLDTYVMGQDEAKRTAAIMLWNHLHGLKTNTLFIGPSGSGKTHIWRTLRQLPVFNVIIGIADASEITQKGWKGNIKSDNALGELFYGRMSGMDEMLPYAETSIIIYDEFDKLVVPQHSYSGENVSYSIQAQFLAMVEGAEIKVRNPQGGDDYTVIDTKDISFGFCGAFEELYEKRHKLETTTAMGFGNENKPKVEPITIEDIIDYGTRPELAGRISHITTLEPLDKSQIVLILQNQHTSPVTKYVKAYGMEICITDEYSEFLAEKILDSSMGIRQLSSLVDEDMNRVVFNAENIPYNEMHVTLMVDKHGRRVVQVSRMKKKPAYVFER